MTWVSWGLAGGACGLLAAAAVLLAAALARQAYEAHRWAYL